MVDKFRLHRTGTKLSHSLVHGAPNDYESNVPAITVRPECHWNDGPNANIVCLCRSWTFLRLMLTKHRLRSGKRRTMSRADHWTHVRSKLFVKMKYSTCGHGGVRVHGREGRNPVGLKWIDTNKGSAEASRCRSRLVCTEVRHQGVEPIFSATPPLETLRVLLCAACQEDVFRVEDPS